MKLFVTTFLFLTATSAAFATEWTCEAYCNVDQGSQGSILLVGHGSNPQLAFDRVALECGQINYPYSQDSYGYADLFSTTGEHHEEATVANSCKMFDPTI